MPTSSLIMNVYYLTLYSSYQPTCGGEEGSEGVVGGHRAGVHQLHQLARQLGRVHEVYGHLKQKELIIDYISLAKFLPTCPTASRGKQSLQKTKMSYSYRCNTEKNGKY